VTTPGFGQKNEGLPQLPATFVEDRFNLRLLFFEGVVAKWKGGTYRTAYRTDKRTSWLKVRNRQYSQIDGRRELFEAGRDNRQRREGWLRPQVVLA
jgi:hypothetical protein